MKTIIIAGGSGFLGQVLEIYFLNKGFLVKILTRNPKRDNEIYWDANNLGEWTESLENAEALINLTGKSVDCRYTEANKKLIYDSRIDSTHLLGLAINLCENPPKMWFNSSTATIYEGSTAYENDEATGIIGDDFSMNIAKSWEEAFYSIKNPKTRKIALRTSIVLGRNGGALIPLKQLTHFGLGGKQASGNQKVSWIHEEDFARAINFLMQRNELEGNFNICVPGPTTNKNLMAALRTTLNIPIGISHPTWLLKLGAQIIGTETELILKSRNVVPQRLLQNGFNFKFDEIAPALTDLIKN
ncbi:MAG: TIGR01777 family oxidoreductase [Aquaticitalea sp.]